MNSQDINKIAGTLRASKPRKHDDASDPTGTVKVDTDSDLQVALWQWNRMVELFAYNLWQEDKSFKPTTFRKMCGYE